MIINFVVQMISAEAPVLFAKAAEMFITEISLRAWIHTEDNKRRTLQRNDIAMAITKYDQFDFLIDIVPRDELKPAKRQENEIRTATGAPSGTVGTVAPDQIQYYLQLAQQHHTALQQQGVATPQGQLVQIVQSPVGQFAVAPLVQLQMPTSTAGDGVSQNVVQHQVSQNQVSQAQVLQIAGQTTGATTGVQPLIQPVTVEVSNFN